MVLVIRYEIHRPIKGPETDRSAKINWQSLAASVMLQLWMVAERLTPLVELISATDPMWPCLPHPTPLPLPKDNPPPKFYMKLWGSKNIILRQNPKKKMSRLWGRGEGTRRQKRVGFVWLSGWDDNKQVQLNPLSYKKTGRWGDRSGGGGGAGDRHGEESQSACSTINFPSTHLQQGKKSR